MSAWPATLPQYVNQSGYSETRAKAKLETEMDSGPVVMRNLFNAVPTVFNIVMTMTNDQVSDLETFYGLTTYNGTATFTWEHPRKTTEAVPVAATMRFKGNPPKYSYKSYDYFNVSFSVEIQP